jgi:hypothetical protein
MDWGLVSLLKEGPAKREVKRTASYLSGCRRVTLDDVPRPRVGVFDSGIPDLAENADRYLEDFGER